MKFPSLTQLDAMDCGPTCLRMVAKFYGRSYSLQSLRERCHITREGVSLLGISDAAESIGFRTTGVKITWEQLRDEMPMPCIVHWNQRHFVVVYGVVKRRKGTVVRVADPASGLLEYRAEDFLKSWLQSEDKSEGIALILEPTPQFYQEEGEEKKKYGFSYVFINGETNHYHVSMFRNGRLTVYNQTCIKCRNLWICGGGCPNSQYRNKVFGEKNEVCSPLRQLSVLNRYLDVRYEINKRNNQSANCY